jgi:hypothetical protein
LGPSSILFATITSRRPQQQHDLCSTSPIRVSFKSPLTLRAGP